MKPLSAFNDKNKETLFNLQVYACLDSIDKKANEWFNETFIDVKEYIPQDVLVSNLLDDLDYIFTQAIWWIELGESLGYVMDSKRFIETQYERYTRNDNGYRSLVRDERYCYNENRLLTTEEIETRNKEMEKISKEILDEILDDLKK